MSGQPNPWVFGYGSLMWNPGFPYLRSHPATLRGFHRSLSVYSHQYRGTPLKPGLVFGLDRGGSCRGVAFEVDVTHWPKTLDYLREREQITNVYIEVVKPVQLADGGTAAALTFIVNRDHSQYAGKLPDESILQLVRQGQGQFGPCTEYVSNTLEHLRKLGIHDRKLEAIARKLRGPEADI